MITAFVLLFLIFGVSVGNYNPSNDNESTRNWHGNSIRGTGSQPNDYPKNDRRYSPIKPKEAVSIHEWDPE